ncbi:MAG: helix-turn-helix domain-containing protein [Myxococcaceae bacterium]
MISGLETGGPLRSEERIGWIRSGGDRVEPIPSSVLCWSSGATWRTFRIEEHTSSSGDLPQGCFTGHILALNVGGPYRVEISWSGAPPSAEHAHLPGNFIFVPASRPLSAVWQGPATVLLVEILAGSVNPCDAVRLGPVLNRRDDFVAHLVLALRDLARLHSEPGAGYGESLCAALTEHLARSSSTWCDRVGNGHALSSTCLRRVLEFVDAHLDKSISLDALAHESGTSPFHFARLFKRRTGLAPHQFIIRKRIERARALLSDADLSIGEVAFRCGFSQQSHFTVTFRRTVGVSPSAYRRLL